MTELPGREDVRQAPRVVCEQTRWPSAAALVGQVSALLAAVTDLITLHVAVIAGFGGSVLAIVALVESASAEFRARRAFTTLIGAQGLAAAIMLSGLAPSVPRALPLAALAA